MLLTAGERISNALVAMADPRAGGAGALVHRLAGRDGHHVQARRRPHRAGQPAPDPRGARPRAPSCSSPASRASARTRKDVTTLGRGGSDTTAVALAAALEADVCEIYTDVDGIFSADPRIVPDAQRLDSITYEEMLEMAACGAKVLHLRAVEYARRYGVPLRVRSSYNDKPGIARHRLDRGDPLGERDHHRGRARPVRSQDHRRRGAGHARAWRRGSSARSPTPTSTSTWCCRTSAAPARRTPTSRSRCRASTGRARSPRSPACSAEIGFAEICPRRRGRQGLARRRGHAQPPRRHRHVLRGALGGRASTSRR